MMSTHLEKELLHFSASGFLHSSFPHSKLLMTEILEKIAHPHLACEVSHRFSSAGSLLARMHKYHDLLAPFQGCSHLVTGILVHNIVPPHLLLLCYANEGLVQRHGTVFGPEKVHS